MDIDTDNPLGRFLRARRELLRPEDLGLVAGARRRVTGLRRGEVARLAGVSTDYYVRLEQGRERRPSPQVLDALARALELDEDATAHLHLLARRPPGRRRRHVARERVSPRLLHLMAAWPDTPAVVMDHCLTVVAANPLGAALFDGHAFGGDLVRLVFLDPDARDFYPEWERVAGEIVAGLRAAVGTEYDDPRFVELIGELSVRSETFRRLWARHDIRRKTNASKRLRHPLVGELTLHYESFTVNSAPGQQLVVYQAEPGSPSEEALSLLGSLTADNGTHAAPHRPPTTAEHPPRP